MTHHYHEDVSDCPYEKAEALSNAAARLIDSLRPLVERCPGEVYTWCQLTSQDLHLYSDEWIEYIPAPPEPPREMTDEEYRWDAEMRRG